MVPENRAKKYKNLFKSMSKIKSMKIGSEGVAVVLDMRMVSFMKANAIDQFHRSLSADLNCKIARKTISVRR